MRIARSTGAASGLLIALLGTWGALIPFVGPYFDYSFGINATWHYTTDRLLLNILPGAVALAAGLLLIRAGSRALGALGGWLALLAGAWFAVGAALSRIWEHAASPIGGPLGGSTRQALELVGCFYGLGVLIVALSAFAVGRFVSRPALVAAEEPVPVPIGPSQREQRVSRRPRRSLLPARRRPASPPVSRDDRSDAAR